MKDNKKRAGIRFTNNIYINFIYDPDTNMVEVYKNGELVTSGDFVTLEDLMEILEAYVTKAELEIALSTYITNTDLDTALESYITQTELESTLETTLESYVKNDDLSNTLENYVEKSNLYEIDAGSVTGQCNAGSYTDLSITFNKTFNSTPIVVSSLATTSTAPGVGNISTSPINITTTGCSIRVFNNDTSNRTPKINWIAIKI